MYNETNGNVHLSSENRTLDWPRVAGYGNVILHEHWKDTKLTFFVKTGLFLI